MDERMLDQSIEICSFPRDMTYVPFEKLPSLDSVENLEEHRSKENFIRCLRSIRSILNIAYQILTYSINDAKYVRKSEGLQNWIVGPRRGQPRQASLKYRVAFSRKAPIGVIDYRGG
jgi:hypothetical protein